MPRSPTSEELLEKLVGFATVSRDSNLEMIGFKGSEVVINVLNAHGQEIYSEMHTRLQGDFRHQLDLSDRAQGVYFIQLKANGRSRVDRISIL